MRSELNVNDERALLVDHFGDLIADVLVQGHEIGHFIALWPLGGCPVAVVCFVGALWKDWHVFRHK